MTLTWSAKRVWLIIAIGVLLAGAALVGSEYPLWQRALQGSLGLAAIGFGAARYRRVGEPVLVLDSSGLRDTRLRPAFLTREAIRSISFEPSYWAGGALLIELHKGAPRVEVHNPPFVMRGRESKVRGSEVRLSLDGLAFDSASVRAALAPYSANAAA